MKKYFLLCIFFPLFAYTQIINEQKDTLFPVPGLVYKLGRAQNFKYGYINKEGKMIIEPQFHYASNFKNGTAIVDFAFVSDFGYPHQLRPPNSNDIKNWQEHIKKHVINTKGEIIGEEPRSFSEGYAVFLKEYKGKNKSLRYKQGYVDSSGNLKIPPIYDFTNNFKEGLGRVGYIDKSGKVKYGFINIEGDTVIPFIYTEAYDFNKEMALVRNEQYNYLFINKEGVKIIPNQFNMAYPYSDGVACVADSNNLYGYIDKKGDWVIKPQYQKASSFSEGFAIITEPKSETDYNSLSFRFIDKSGNSKFNRSFSTAEPFYHGLALVSYEVSNEQIYEYINTEGKAIWKRGFFINKNGEPGIDEYIR